MDAIQGISNRVTFAFSEREDGNMSLAAGEREAVLSNRNNFLQRYKLEDYPLILLNQVHGDKVCVIDDPIKALQLSPPDGDAIITNCRNVIVGVMTADCLPIVIFDKNRKGVGVIHAGRKGSALKIAYKTVEKFAELFNVDKGEIVAIMGSGIGSCCYEVEDDMLVPFRDDIYSLSDIAEKNSSGKFMLDLSVVNEIQLTTAGLSGDNIFRLGNCTSCGDKYFSYRGGDRLDRMLAIVAISN